MIRHLFPAERLRNHEQVLTFVMRRIREDLALRGGRGVVLAHCFAAGVAPAAVSSEVLSDITAGGLDLVPVAVFGPSDGAPGDGTGPDGAPSDGPDYVALELYLAWRAKDLPLESPAVRR